MFCPNCGTNLPDGSAICTGCGYQLSRSQQSAPQQSAPRQAAPQQPQYQQPAYQQPQYRQPVYQQPAPQPAYRQPAAPVIPAPISKKEYLSSKAPESVKKMAGVVTITFILSLVLVIVSAVAPLAMNFFDIPAMSFMMTMADADPDELVEELEDAYGEAEYKYEIQKSTMDKDEKEAAKKVLDSMDKLLDNFSLLNFNALVSTMESVGDDYLDSSDMDDIEEVSDIMNIVIVGVIAFFILPLLFTVLGGLNKSTALTVTALVFTVISQLIFSGILWVLLSFVVFIVQAVQCSKINKAYQDYRVGRFAA